MVSIQNVISDHKADLQIMAQKIISLEKAFKNSEKENQEIKSQPWLGNATTAELIDEIRCRIEIDGKLDYKTVGENKGESNG